MRVAICLAAATGLLLGGNFAQAQAEKFSLTMFHFNVQYVAGGLTGYPSGDGDNPDYDLDDEAVQDMIIVQSFEPILDLFSAHPDWKVTLEMQAYMVEIMEQRHPGILEKLKVLADAGQAEVVSFHWSDQLFLAYPARDMQVSHDIMEPIWERVGIQPSRVVFCQEGQFGVGMIPLGLPRGRSIYVLPKNLFRYQHQAEYETAAPLYNHGGADIVIGSRSFATPEVEVSWSFFDDGELLATGGHAPYFPTAFVVDMAAIAEYEQRLEDQVAAGFRIAAIADYVTWAKAEGLESRPLPPMLDGTWQPPSTDSMHRWMGASGLLDQVYGGERDNAVLTGNVAARHRIAAAENLVAFAQGQGLAEAGQYDQTLEGCWRDVLLAQVSDASGINPFVREVEYGLEHAAAAATCANQVIAELGPKLGGPFIGIDTGSGLVMVADDQPVELAQASEALFLEGAGFSVEAAGRELSMVWEKMGLEEGITRLTVTVSDPDAGQRELEVAFPLTLNGFRLTPGLTDADSELHSFEAFDLLEGRITLPVANGLIGLDDDLWLIKQTDRVHIGATFAPDSGRVRFVDQTLDPAAGDEWVFWFVRGTEEQALALAKRLNLTPVVWVETGVKPNRGCDCGTPAGPGLYGLIGLLLVMAWRRSAL